MTRVLAFSLVIALSAFAVSAQQQSRDAVRAPAATGTAQIAGTVVTAGDTPQPLRRATVVATAEQSGVRLVAVTDDAGAFAFTNLPADRYSLVVSKPAYVPSAYGSKRPGGSGTPVVVSDGQRVNVFIPLLRGSAIGGTIRDEQGRVLPDVTVSVLRRAPSFLTGARELQSVTMGSAGAVAQNYALDAFPGTAVTDDRGMYRIYGLPPGDYVISAAVRPPRGSPLVSNDLHQITAADLQRAQQLLRGPGQAPAADPVASAAGRAGGRVDYVPIYHPAAIAAQDASTVTLGPAEDRPGIDITVRLVPTARVSGFISAPDGSPVSGAQVSVMDPMSPSGGVFRTTRSGFDGDFVMEGIPPGRYEVQAGAYPSGLFGATEIFVQGRDVETSFVLEPGVTVSGRVVFDGTAPVPATPLFPWLARQRWTIGGGGGETSPGGGFKMLRVVPGRYTLGLNGRPPAGWVLRSVVVNGVDVTDATFEIRRGENIDNAVLTLTDKPAEISGTLQDTTGAPAPEYVLIVFSADQKQWIPRARRTQHVRPDIRGRFIARDLPAGDYLISAVTDIEDNQWNDPAFLAALAAASPIKVTVAEGDKKVQDIRVARR
jgi:hypothetical protein